MKTIFSSLIAIAIAIAIALLALSSAARADDRHDGRDGPLAVSVVSDLALPDAARGIAVHVKVYAPQSDGPHPTIVFSHGAGGSKDGYEFLGRYWATWGYISIHPTHAGSDTSLLRGKGGIGGALQAVRDSVEDPVEWRARAADVKCVLDSLGAIEAAVGGRIDRERIGLAGHSYGAFTALEVGGASVFEKDGTRLDLSDARPRAFAALSPQGLTIAGFHRESFSSIDRPFLLATGSADGGFNGRTSEWRLAPFKLMPDGERYLLWIDGANHMTFAGLGTRDQRAWIRVTTLAFWDAELRGDEAGRRFLRENGVGAMSDAKARIEAKPAASGAPALR